MTDSTKSASARMNYIITKDNYTSYKFHFDTLHLFFTRELDKGMSVEYVDNSSRVIITLSDGSKFDVANDAFWQLMVEMLGDAWRKVKCDG